MKFKLFVFTVFLGLTSVSYGQVTQKDVSQFLKSFENAVKSGDEKAVLWLMDPIYRSEQHDKNLEGNTELFLKEFFCGEDAGKYYCFKLDEIKKIKQVSVEQVSGSEWRVIYKIKSKDKMKVQAEWIVIPHKDGTHEALGLVGAVG